MDSPPESSPSITLDPDLAEMQESFLQYFEECDLARLKNEENERKIGLLESEIQKFGQKENEMKERIEQCQLLIISQQEHMNELLAASIEAHELKKILKTKELMHQAEKCKVETERDAVICTLENEKKILIEKYEKESAAMLEKLIALEQENEETGSKMEQEHLATVNDLSSKIAQKDKEISELSAQHAAEVERVTQTIEDYKRMVFDLREKTNSIINSHQKVLTETDRHSKNETESLKLQIESLQNQLNDQVQQNILLRDELQRSNKIREELSVRLRANRATPIRATDTSGMERIESRPVQERPLSFGHQMLPSPIPVPTTPNPFNARVAASTPLPVQRQRYDVSEVSDALAMQTLSSQKTTEKRSFAGRRDPVNLSDEEKMPSPTYPLTVKKKKLFSEDRNEFL